MPITALPTPPLRSDGPATFADKGDAFMAALPIFEVEMNSLQAGVTADKLLTEQAVIDAQAQAVASAASAAAAGAIAWVSGTTYAIGDARYSPADMQTYRRKIAGAGTTDPSLDGTNWTRVNLAPSSVTLSVRTSNTILGTGDRSTLIDITSGTFTQTFAACASLGGGWFCYLKNSGTGDITLDPNASETIDGLTSFVMYPGEVRLIQCDGAALRSIVINAFVKSSATSFTFVKPPGYTSLYVELLGGGGGGGNGNVGPSLSGGGGGGGGCCTVRNFPHASVGSSVTVGIAASSSTVGGTSTFGTMASAFGGAKGGPGPASAGVGAYGGPGGGSGSAGVYGALSGYGVGSFGTSLAPPSGEMGAMRLADYGGFSEQGGASGGSYASGGSSLNGGCGGGAGGPAAGTSGGTTYPGQPGGSPNRVVQSGTAHGGVAGGGGAGGVLGAEAVPGGAGSAGISQVAPAISGTAGGGGGSSDTGAGGAGGAGGFGSGGGGGGSSRTGAAGTGGLGGGGFARISGVI